MCSRKFPTLGHVAGVFRPREVLVNSKVLCQGLRKAIEDISPIETMKNSCLDSGMVEIFLKKQATVTQWRIFFAIWIYLISTVLRGGQHYFGKGLWFQLLIFWWVYWNMMVERKLGCPSQSVMTFWSLRFTLVGMLDFYIVPRMMLILSIYIYIYKLYIHNIIEIKWAFHHLGMSGLR